MSSLYIGFFALPLLLSGSVRQKLNWKHGIAFLFLLFCIVIVWPVVPIGNGINDLYISPITLNDVYFIRMPHNQTLAAAVWIVLKLMAASGAVLFVRSVFRFAKNPFVKNEGAVFPGKSEYLFFFYITGYILLLVLSPTFLDRYLLPIIFMALLLLALSLRDELKKLQTGFLVFCIVLSGLFSLAGTHDYFQWNRERWKAIHYLTEEKKIPTSQIDGGYEFNGWNKYSAAFNSSGGVSNWWVTNAEDYLITMHPLPGAKVLKTYSYFQWLSLSEQKIYLLQKYDPETYAIPPRKAIDFEVEGNDTVNTIHSFSASNFEPGFSVTAETAHSGSRCLKLAAQNQYTPDVPSSELHAADYFFITCWTKLDSINLLRLEITDKKTSVKIHPSIFKTEGEWKQLVFSHYVVPLETMKNFSLIFSNESDKQVFLDDIVMRREDNKPSDSDR